jgi:acetylornithine deacetylase/succinyl-diaminopimelate desuccinylase family protein
MNCEKLLRELIALPSVNPAFVPPGDPRAGEGRVAEFVAASAASAGLDVSLEPALPHRPNVIARLSPAGKVRRTILLAPHLDTVNAEPAGFEPRLRAGRIYGRGACDTKGSVAAMLAAVCEVARSRPPRKTEIVFAGLIDEEQSQAGSRALVTSRFKADLAIVGEPTCLKVVTAHKGSLWVRLEAQGKSAHGARPELGKNAIHMMARVVDVLETAYAASLTKRGHELLGPPTVNVGVIQGGTQPNIVPDHCSVIVDRRTLPGESEKTVRAELSACLKKAGLRAAVSFVKSGPCGAMETSPKLPLIAQFMRSLGQDQPAGVHYFCDAAVLSRGGIPSIVFGPGDIAQAHTADEWINVNSLRQAQAALTRFLRSLP